MVEALRRAGAWSFRHPITHAADAAVGLNGRMTDCGLLPKSRLTNLTLTLATDILLKHVHFPSLLSTSSVIADMRRCDPVGVNAAAPMPLPIPL